MAADRERKSWRRRLLHALPFVVVLAAILGGTAWFIVLRPPLSRDFGPDALAMDCVFARYCRDGACDGALPDPARIVLNGYLGRSYMIWGRPLGQATVLTRDTGTTYATRLDDERFAVFEIHHGRDFEFRMTRQLIDAPGYETGHGQCSEPAPLPEAT